MPKELELGGMKITEIRKLNAKEMETEGWDGNPPTAIILEDGTKLYPSRDGEGNGPGVMFGRKGKHSFYL